MDNNEIVVKATTWETLSVRLPDLDRSTEITIEHPPSVRIGTAAIAIGSHRIPLELHGADGVYTATVSDVTDASLSLTLKATPPVTDEGGVVTLTLREKAKQVAFTLAGKPAFLLQRTKWLAPDTINVNEETDVLLRVRNDGSSDAEGLVVDVPTPENVLVTSDEARVVFQGGVRILRFAQDRFAVGECRELCLSAIALKHGRVSWGAEIYGDNVTALVVTAESHAVMRTAADLTMRTPTTAVELREPFPIHVELTYRGAPQEQARIRFEGGGIAVEQIDLGGLQSHEDRAIKVLGHVTEAKAEAWEAPLRAFLETPDGIVANAATKVLGRGTIAVDMQLHVADEDASFARAVTLSLRNIGTADVAGVVLYLQRVDNLSPVLDSLLVDGRPRLAVDGAVPVYAGIALETIAIDSTAAVTLRLRSSVQQIPDLVFVAAREGICLATAVAAASFSDAARRTIETSETEAPVVQPVDAIAPEPVAVGDASSTPEAGPQDGTPETAQPEATDETSTIEPPAIKPVEEPPAVEPGLVALEAVPDENALFLSDAFGTLARNIMALYGLAPAAYQGDEAVTTKFALLRAEIGAIYRREADAVRDDSFGVVGYEFAPASLGAALAEYQRAIGADVVDTTNDRAVIAAIVRLADCDGIAQEDLATWKDLVATRVMAMRSDADFERPALTGVTTPEENAA